MPRLKEWGYDVGGDLERRTVPEVQRFLREWAKRMGGRYVGVSLPSTSAAPEGSVMGRMLGKAVLPVCEELDLPLAMMIGVKRRVNPDLRMAGDGVGVARIENDGRP